jgi:TldD protein
MRFRQRAALMHHRHPTGELMLTRRRFMTGVGAGALVAGALSRRAWGAAAATPPTEDPKALIHAGLEAARAAGASWADVRIDRRRSQSMATEDDHVVHTSDDEDYGVGVRVIVDGVWGFAATWHVDKTGVVKAAHDAVAVAKANQRAAGRRVALAPTAKAVGKWSSPFEIDPFTVPVSQKAEALVAACRAALDVKGVQTKVQGQLHFISDERIIGNSEGAYFEQRAVRGLPLLNVTVIDTQKGEFETVQTDSLIPPAAVGFEVLQGGRLTQVAERAVEMARKRMGAKPVEAGKYDLVLAPSNLWLTIHETVGHSTELDRMLGYEANLAGTSFLKVSDIGTLKYGTPIVNVVADRTQPHALGTLGWDDDGQAGDAWDLIKDGTLVGVQTTREQAAWLKADAGHSGNWAMSWSSMPFQRMPNVSLQPSPKPLTPEQLIGDTKRGIYIEGRGSWSIDHQRYNFQFGGQAFTMIENGKLTKPLRYVGYQSNTLDFWRACDAICDKSDYYLGGSLSDGKGEPMQVNPVSHGCVTSRFRNMRVINTRA